MALNLVDVDIQIGERQLFHNFNLKVEKGGFCVLMGPSGSGKSTLFNFILGNLPSSDFTYSGKISLEGVELNALAPEKRNVGILFQDILLFPHLSVTENLAFGMRGNQSRKEKLKKIEQALAQAQLSGLENQNPETLSGGERSRVGLLRTLISEPRAILLDEPFSKLDKKLRDEFRRWVFDTLRERAIPVMLATHDPSDISDLPEKYRQVIDLSHV